MEELTTYKTFKQNLDNELNRAAEGFVKIGYLLKLARDNPHILAGSGYTNINEMANKEYGIDKTIVSRWISINDEFQKVVIQTGLRVNTRDMDIPSWRLCLIFLRQSGRNCPLPLQRAKYRQSKMKLTKKAILPLWRYILKDRQQNRKDRR